MMGQTTVQIGPGYFINPSKTCLLASKRSCPENCNRGTGVCISCNGRNTLEPLLVLSHLFVLLSSCKFNLCNHTCPMMLMSPSHMPRPMLLMSPSHMPHDAYVAFTCPMMLMSPHAAYVAFTHAPCCLCRLHTWIHK